MKKIFRQIHLWLSVPFGLVITLVCFSGAMLVFEDEVTRMVNGSLYKVERVGDKPLPLDVLVEKVSSTLPDSIKVTGVGVSSDPEEAYKVNLSKPRRAALYVDQYTGEVKGRSERLPFFMSMFRLHRWLLDSLQPGEGVFWGKIIVGVSTIVFIFVLVSGIVVWLPRTSKAFKNSMKISVRHGLRRFLYGLHVAGGMYALLLLLAMALTGLTWSFSWYRAGFYKVFGAEVASQRDSRGGGEQSKGHGTDGSKGGKDRAGADRKGDKPAAEFAHWQHVLDKLRVGNEGFRQITVSGGKATVQYARYGNTRASDSYEFDKATGRITAVSLYKDKDISGSLRGWIYSVHVGSWGGMLTRILWFLAALMGATLPLTGYYLWIKRLMRRS